MARYTLLAATLIFLAEALAVPLAGDGKNIQILPAGYTDADVKVADNEEWWVLFCAPGTSPWLRYAPVSVSPKDKDVQRHIRAEGFVDDEVILLFSGTKELERGPIATYFTGHLPLAPGLQMSFGPWQRPEPQLSVKNDVPAGDTPSHKLSRYEVLWQSQLLVTPEAIPDAPGFYARLIWVGDLDRDDKPDLLLDVGLAPSARKLCLFLSSFATGNEVVHLVAMFTDHSC